MVRFSAKKPAKIFLQIFVPFVFSIIILIFAISFVLYSNFKNIALEMVYKDSESNLKSISLSAANMKESLSSLALQCYFDDTINEMLYYSPSIYDFSRLSTHLYSYKNIFSFLDSIYVYNGKDFFVCPGYSFMYSKDNFADKDILKILNNMSLYPSNSIIYRRINNSLYSDSTGQSYVYTYIFYDSQLSGGSVNQAIILNVSPNWIKQNIETFNNASSRILIINGKGQTMIEDSKNYSLTNLSNQKYITDILHSNNTSGYFMGSADGQLSLISYISTNLMDWKFISITPYSQIIAKINVIRDNTLIIGFAILLIGVFVTLYLSRRLFMPFKSMIIDVNDINNEKRRNFYKNKQELIIGLVANNKVISPEQFKEYGFKFSFSSYFTMLLFKIDNFSLFCSDYNLNDRSLMKFGIINITDEILSQKFKCECADIREDSILVLMNGSTDDDQKNHEIIFELLNIIKKNIKEHLDLSLTITIGSHNIAYSELNDEYRRILETSEYRMIKGLGSIILANEVHFEPADDYAFPADKEKALIEAIMLGQSPVAKEMIEDIATYSGKFGRSIFNTSFLRLMLSLENSIMIIQKNNLIATDFDFDTYLDNIRSMETIPEILDKFFKLFDSISNQLEKNKYDKHDKLLENVVDIVNLKYSSPDLCLDSIADMVKISPYYLSKLFKKHKFVSLNDYINNIRIEKARELILEQEQPISTILEKTGFSSSSHFYTLFKKAYGITPNQLRKKL